jgi:hypothetical protein
MAERPNIPLSQFRSRVEESSETHRSTVVPRTEQLNPEHRQGRMTPAERQASVDRAAAELLRASGGA